MAEQDQSPVVGQVTVQLLANGNVRCRADVPNRFMFNGMMAHAQFDMNQKFVEAEQQKQSRIVAPPPEASIANLRG